MKTWITIVMMSVAVPVVAQEAKEGRLCRVESEVFELVMYSSQSKILTLVFDNGRVYEYYQVPVSLWQGIMATKRKGSFFNKRIRSKYKYRRVI